MSNCGFVDGVMLTDNCSSRQGVEICRITPHYMDWYTDGQTCCEMFCDPDRQASANYCIGKDGDIWLNVEERFRAWTTGSGYNDRMAVTIECASYTDAENYGKLPDATWASLVKLCVDICQRNGIEKLNYTGDDSGNLTMHKWYQATDCPGPWFSGQFGRLMVEVNKLLNGGYEPEPSPPMVFGGLYRCTVDGLNVRTEPNLHSQVVAQYFEGDLVNLDDWSINNEGYAWGRYIGMSSGRYRYIAVGRATGKVEPDDYLIKV